MSDSSRAASIAARSCPLHHAQADSKPNRLTLPFTKKALCLQRLPIACLERRKSPPAVRARRRSSPPSSIFSQNPPAGQRASRRCRPTPCGRVPPTWRARGHTHSTDRAAIARATHETPQGTHVCVCACVCSPVNPSSARAQGPDRIRSLCAPSPYAGPHQRKPPNRWPCIHLRDRYE